MLMHIVYVFIGINDGGNLVSALKPPICMCIEQILNYVTLKKS